MPFLVVDGPEKAGKTTLINEVMSRHAFAEMEYWTGPANDLWDTRNLTALKAGRERAEGGDLMVWSRSWASEYVYGSLLKRMGSKVAQVDGLGEWLYGRAVQACGLRVMVVPAKASEAAARRDRSDHPVDPRLESILFEAYARRFGWLVLKNDYTMEGLERSADAVEHRLASACWSRSQLPSYAGPWVTPVTFVSTRGKEVLSEAKGEWLPFSSAAPTFLGTEDALKCGWAYAHEVSPNKLRGAKTLIATDDVAFRWCTNHVGHRDVRLWPTLKRLAQPGQARQREQALAEFTACVEAYERVEQTA
jgi:hypothetical protein